VSARMSRCRHDGRAPTSRIASHVVNTGGRCPRRSWVYCLSSSASSRFRAEMNEAANGGGLLGGRAIILLLTVVYHDRHPRSLVIVVIEEHGIGADPPIFQFYTAYAQYKAAGTVIGFA
jgi:hypothetical protein